MITLGGSSGASALVSGIAALVWSQNPAMTRDQVRARLQTTAWRSNLLGNGIGVVNAYAATGGIRSAQINGPSAGVADTQTFALQTEIVGAGPYAFLWDRGETSAAVSRTGPGVSSVSVRDLTDNNVIQLSFTARPVASSPIPPQPRPSDRVCRARPWLAGCNL